MKRIKFSPELVSKILSGEKTSTWRIFDEKNLQPNDSIELIDADSQKVFANAKIVHVTSKKISSISSEDYTGHEKYSSLTEIIQTFQKFYNTNVNGDTIVKIITFQLIKDKI